MSFIGPLWQRWQEWKAKQAIVLLLAFGAVFFVISWAIHRPGVEAVDLRFTRTVQSLQNFWMDIVMGGFTIMGNTLTLILLAAVLVGYFIFLRRPIGALLIAVSLIGLPINMLLKVLVGRPRPSGDLVSVLAPTIGLSFPSGHAMASTMFYGFLAVLCWMHVTNPSVRLLSTIALAGTALMVSLSRIYMGAHWLSDVVGGWTAGIFLLVLVVEAYKHWGKPEVARVTSAAKGPKALTAKRAA